jgi:hypothetical protein
VKSSKRARQYEHIKESAQKRGRSTKRAKEIAAATVNKQRRQAGETKGSRKSSSSRKSTSGTRKRTAARTSRKTSRSSATRKR